MQGKPEFSLLYRVQSESYKQYNQEFVKTWRLKDTESVVMAPAASMYVGYEAALSRQDAKYLAIAMLPCTMLWLWIAGQLINSVDPKNPYYDWLTTTSLNPTTKAGWRSLLIIFSALKRKRSPLLSSTRGGLTS